MFNKIGIKWSKIPVTLIFVLMFSLGMANVALGAVTNFTTTPATAICGTSAVTGGQYKLNAGTTVTNNGVVYSTSASTTADLIVSSSGVASAETQVVTAGNGGNRSFSVTLSELTPGTKYYYRAYYVSGGVTTYDTNINSFNTLAETSIAVTHAPTKTDYIEGQIFDSKGMVVTAYFSSGLPAVVPIESYTVSPSPLTLGTTSVTIALKSNPSCTATTPVTVAAKVVTQIRVTSPPTKTNYGDGQYFDKTGMVVTATYNDTSEAAVPTGSYVVSPSPLTMGTTDVTITLSSNPAITATTPVTVSLVTYQGVQKRMGFNDIRFLATIDTLDADLVGFVFSKTNSMPTTDDSVISTSTVYNFIMASDAIVTATSLNGKYIIACTVIGIPDIDLSTPLYVRAFSTKNGVTTYTSARTVIVNNLQ
jgi:hypothetical protein